MTPTKQEAIDAARKLLIERLGVEKAAVLMDDIRSTWEQTSVKRRNSLAGAGLLVGLCLGALVGKFIL